MTQIENLDKLADQIYQEGIEKANKESEEIIAEAKVKAKKIIDEAELKAKEVIQKSEKEADKLKNSALNEVKVKSKQAVSDLKESITSSFLHKHLDQKVTEVFEDAAFIKNLLLKVTENWSNSSKSEVIVSPELKQKIEAYLKDAAQKNLAGLRIQTGDEVKTGFVIDNKEEGYFISFTDEDFQAFLQPYFSQKLNELLFDAAS